MHTPQARELLNVWERGMGTSPARRGLLLLAAALPGVDADALRHASIGHRDAWLLSLRESLFGQHVECLSPCPACGERIELAFEVDAIRAAHALPRAMVTVARAGAELRFRVPDSDDLLAIEGARDAVAAERLLLQRCRIDGGPPSSNAAAVASDLNDTEAIAVAKALADADPQAEVLLDATCPVCGHAATLAFDIVGHLWTELDHWARGMLLKIHAIATCYGWSEEAILGLSPARRQAYLDLIGAA